MNRGRLMVQLCVEAERNVVNEKLTQKGETRDNTKSEPNEDIPPTENVIQGTIQVSEATEPSFLESTHDSDDYAFEDSGSEYIPSGSSEESASSSVMDSSKILLDTSAVTSTDGKLNPFGRNNLPSPNMSQNIPALPSTSGIQYLQFPNAVLAESLREERDTGEVTTEPIQEHPQVDLGEFTNNGGKRVGNKKKDFCFYCETYVLNFARHVLRNHATETEVQKISSLPPKSQTRSKLLRTLRTKGNFLNSNNIRKPIRRPITSTDILPCTNCMGFFSAKQLWRHRKLCMGKSEKFHQARAQDFLLKSLRVDGQLKEKVFPRMRADKISLTAKTDPLICAYGARYLKSHREKHFVNVTSRKMRELARLLIEVKKLKPSVKNFFEALKPENFEIIVAATKIVGHYNEDTDFFESATTALNLGTAIKQCCQIAIVLVLKRKQLHSTVSAAQAEADLKTLIQLVDSEWRFDISTQAINDLNVKKWNKITMIPLASDLKLIKEFLVSKANSAVNELKLNCNNKHAYIVLLETVFCRVLLLNRRRPGELQRLPLHVYERSDHPEHYEEFSEVVTPSEKVLLHKFKRIVIRGKRGRGVPVLFSSDIQAHIEVLLKYRTKYVSKNNSYLFGNVNSIYPICGYKIISKYARLSGAKNPQAITATKLRKHLATLTQVLNMSESEIEQLATFMGHTVNVHRGSYRLPDDIFQTAKISKLLLLMEKGEAAQYKGKSLEEINIDLDVDLEMDNESEDEMDEIIREDALPDILSDPSLSGTSRVPDAEEQNRKQNEEKRSKSKRILVPWTKEQKEAARQFFQSHIKNRIPPKKHECLALKEKCFLLLENKDWLKIKVFVQNEYVKLKL